MSTLLNNIMSLIHDGFIVEFKDEGYNANKMQVSKEVRGNIETRAVCLPDDHLEDSKVIGYLKMMADDPIFKLD